MTRNLTTTLARGEIMGLDDAAGDVLHVRHGRLWITEEDGGIDHVVESGQCFKVLRAGRTVIGALLPSSFVRMAPVPLRQEGTARYRAT